MDSEVIRSIGARRFPTVLFRDLRSRLGIRQLIVYRFRQRNVVEVMAAESADDNANMQNAIRRYTLDFSDRDPMVAELDGEAPGRVELCTWTSNMLPDAEFREILYQRQHLVSKTAIIVRRESDALVVALLRGEEAGSLSTSQHDWIAGSFRDIAAAVERHFDLNQLRGVLHPDFCAEFLQALIPVLSFQEANVCASGLLGRSTEATALSMEISGHSVVTYRRRAYAKLGISSQNQLFERLFGRALDFCCDGGAGDGLPALAPPRIARRQ